jgi:hypothetical protein
MEHVPSPTVQTQRTHGSQERGFPAFRTVGEVRGQ